MDFVAHFEVAGDSGAAADDAKTSDRDRACNQGSTGNESILTDYDVVAEMAVVINFGPGGSRSSSPSGSSPPTSSG